MSGEANQALELDEEKALDLDALRNLAARASADYQSYYDIGWSSDYAEDVPVLIAEVERLTQERDEARSALESVRDFAVAVEKQNHEALKNARIGLALTNDVLRRESLFEVVRLLETENQ